MAGVPEGWVNSGCSLEAEDLDDDEDDVMDEFEDVDELLEARPPMRW